MKQEDKDLLLADLCARLPYNVKVIYENKVFSVDYISAKYEEIKLDIPDNYTLNIVEVKPYLFPLTEEILDIATEESNTIYKELISIDSDLYKENNKSNILLLHAQLKSSVIKYFHIHHIDYNGLIGKGLAIDCTNLNIY